MNPLVKKEVRLLLPSWIAAMLLAIFPIWIQAALSQTTDSSPIFSIAFVLGVSFLGLASFGQEFSFKTFTLLLSQPMLRQRIWLVKIYTLSAAFVLVSLAMFISWNICAERHSWGNWFYIFGYASSFEMNVTFAFAVLCGGLWATLLLRQVIAAFWFALLVPVVLNILLLTVAGWLSIGVTPGTQAALLLSYSIAGFFWAHRMFFRAQDVAWTGGTIALPDIKGFPRQMASSGSKRKMRPRTALLKKELHLHSISLFCACVLLMLHIVVFFLRVHYVNYHKNSAAEVGSDLFWMLWLVLPLTIGCTAVAEERKLGMAELQFCLPVSRRFQFAVKFVPAMIFGVLLGGIMPLLLETIAAHLGAQSEMFTGQTHSGHYFGTGLFLISIIALSAGFTLAAIFASTLARNFLQALSITFVTIAGCYFFVSFSQSNEGQSAYYSIVFPHLGILPITIAIPTVVVMYLWLVYGNFSYFHESGRLWRRNIKRITVALLFVLVSSAAIYNRPWEIFEPAEPPHGLAKLSLLNPPTFLNNSYGGDVMVRMPDGRIWVDCISSYAIPGNLWNVWWFLSTHHFLQISEPQFIAGSNWLSATANRFQFGPPMLSTNYTGYQDTVGVKSDGTLWISSESKPDVWSGTKMMQFGTETNWQRVISSQNTSQLLLLKTDGTLWHWEGLINTEGGIGNRQLMGWPTFRNSTPQQFGTGSDWREIIGGMPCYARKSDGSVWSFWPYFYQMGQGEFQRDTNLDQAVFKTFSQLNGAWMAYVGNDGTLWIGKSDTVSYSNLNPTWKQGTGFLQVGKETNWLSVAVTWNGMVALKSDGSLWKWDLPENSPADAARIPPLRLGIHSDWVGLTSAWGGVISLAADGSVWLWQGSGGYGRALMKPPKQPEFLGNIFGKSN